MTFDKPIIIQLIDPETEKWADLWHLHASVNKKTGHEFTLAGAEQSRSVKMFEIRFFRGIEAIDADRGSYRLIYRGVAYNIVDYDDFMEKHQTVKLRGESYDGGYSPN